MSRRSSTQRMLIDKALVMWYKAVGVSLGGAAGAGGGAWIVVGGVVIERGNDVMVKSEVGGVGAECKVWLGLIREE